MNLLNRLKVQVLAAASVVTDFIATVRTKVSDAYKGVRHLPREEQGKLENRYHFGRPLGGFRLQPTGKHHRGWAPYHGRPKSRHGAVSL
jgi:hypothetical protein